MNVFDLFAKITLDKTEYEQGLKKATSLTKEETAQMKKKFLDMQQANQKAMNTLAQDFASGKIGIGEYNSSLSKIISSQKEINSAAQSMGINLKEAGSMAASGWLAVVAAIIKAVQALKQLFDDTIEYADQIGDLAAKYDMTTESVSELQYVASQTGTDIDAMASSMSTLYMKAKSNGDAFKELGVSVTDTNGNFKSMDDLFFETIGALNSLEDEGAKSSYMLDMFGRSAMNNGELLRMTTEDIETMRKTAQELGITVSQSTADFAGSYKDKLDELKLQGQSALSALLAGEDDGEEKLQAFFDNAVVAVEKYLPKFLSFGIRLITYFGTVLIRYMPQLTSEVVSILIDTIFEIDWRSLGIDIAKSVVEGFLNIFVSAYNAVFGKLFGKAEKVDLNVGQSLFVNDTDLNTEYEISERMQQDITVKVEASGDTAVSKESAEKTAEALAPYIDKILGGK